MISLAVAMWLLSCRDILPPPLVPRPVPRIGIPRGEVPIDIHPLPKPPKGTDR